MSGTAGLVTTTLAALVGGTIVIVLGIAGVCVAAYYNIHKQEK